MADKAENTQEEKGFIDKAKDFGKGVANKVVNGVKDTFGFSTDSERQPIDTSPAGLVKGGINKVVHATTPDPVEEVVEETISDNQKPEQTAQVEDTLKNVDFSDVAKVNSGIDTTTNKYQPKSIMQAYYAGDFGDPNSEEAKASRNYMMADAIAKFARNTGRDIGNVGAQFTGGAINNNYEQTSWDEAQNKMVSPQWQAEQQSRELSNVSKQFQNNISRLRGDVANKILAKVKGAKTFAGRMNLMNLANAFMSGQKLSAGELIALGVQDATGL